MFVGKRQQRMGNYKYLVMQAARDEAGKVGWDSTRETNKGGTSHLYLVLNPVRGHS